MRLTWVLLLLLASPASGADNEDRRAVQAAFQKQDASLDWFQVLDKEPMDAADAVMLVEAAPTEPWRGTSRRAPVYPKEQIGLFVVSGAGNQVRLVLDIFALNSVKARPKLEVSGGAAYLNFYSDYGFYRGSIKYVFAPGKKRPPKRFRYGALALQSVTREGGDLQYRAAFPASRSEAGDLPSGWQPRYSIITIHPRGGASAPSYKIADTQAIDDAVPRDPTPLQVGGDKVLVVHNYQNNRGAGIEVERARPRQRFRPLPVPTVEQYAQLRPDAQKPAELENDIGPYASDGATLWFADTFYDGEGISGVGAIGSFDPLTRKFELRYLPEIAAWSGSVVLLDGRDLWVGLVRRPEGANYGGGLLRYNLDSGEVASYPVHDLIYTLDRIGDTIYCGTSNGLYTVRGNRVTQLRFEPDARGKLSMLARLVR